MILTIKSVSRKLWTLPAYLKVCIFKTCMMVLSLESNEAIPCVPTRFSGWDTGALGVVGVSLGTQAHSSSYGPHAFWILSLILGLLHFLLVLRTSCPLISRLSTHSLPAFSLQLLKSEPQYLVISQSLMSPSIYSPTDDGLSLVHSFWAINP